MGGWEGDTLVIDTVGYNGKGQLDELGNPHSNQLHVVERWTQSADGNTLTVQFTFADPVYYARPFSKTREYGRASGQRVGDYGCGAQGGVYAATVERQAIAERRYPCS